MGNIWYHLVLFTSRKVCLLEKQCSKTVRQCCGHTADGFVNWWTDTHTQLCQILKLTPMHLLPSSPTWLLPLWHLHGHLIAPAAACFQSPVLPFTALNSPLCPIHTAARNLASWINDLGPTRAKSQLCKLEQWLSVVQNYIFKCDGLRALCFCYWCTYLQKHMLVFYFKLWSFIRRNGIHCGKEVRPYFCAWTQYAFSIFYREVIYNMDMEVYMHMLYVCAYALQNTHT